MGSKGRDVYWDYVITTCRHMDDWLAITEHFNDEKAAKEPDIRIEPRGDKDFVLDEEGQSFIYTGGWSKYANDTTYVKRIEVTSDTIHIWISWKISGTHDGYLFHNVQPQCRDDFLSYIRSRPFLSEKLIVSSQKVR